MQVNNRLGQRISALRRKRGMTLNEFCFQFDINKATLSKIEGGQNTNPKLSSLLKIAEGLDISVSALLKGIAWPASSR